MAKPHRYTVNSRYGQPRTFEVVEDTVCHVTLDDNDGNKGFTRRGFKSDTDHGLSFVDFEGGPFIAVGSYLGGYVGYNTTVADLVVTGINVVYGGAVLTVAKDPEGYKKYIQTNLEFYKTRSQLESDNDMFKQYFEKSDKRHIEFLEKLLKTL